jgi:cbb3-type cytochrome oxidase maturation protein
MVIFYVLVPVALLLAGASVGAFLWSVRNGQYDDVETPAIRILLDDDPPEAVPGGRSSAKRPSPGGEEDRNELSSDPHPAA